MEETADRARVIRYTRTEASCTAASAAPASSASLSPAPGSSVEPAVFGTVDTPVSSSSLSLTCGPFGVAAAVRLPPPLAAISRDVPLEGRPAPPLHP